MNLKAFEVGKPFPIRVSTQEGAFMELWKSGLVVLIQMPGLRPKEKRAFEISFKRYSYLEINTPVPIAVWIFDFPKPHGPIDVNFNACVSTNYITDFLDTSDGIKNLITFYLLDYQTLCGIKVVGLHHEAINLFHATIRKQLAIAYTQSDYDRYLSATFQFSTEELFKMSTQFKK